MNLCIIKIDFSNTFIAGLPSHCKNLTLTLQNHAFAYQGKSQGTYQIFRFVNERPSWIFKENSKAIWYVPTYDDWAIGDLKDLGAMIRGLRTISNQGGFQLLNLIITELKSHMTC